MNLTNRTRLSSVKRDVRDILQGIMASRHSGGMDGRPEATQPAAHDAAWFDTLFTAHAGRLHRYFVRRLPDGGSRADAAEDLAAEVLATAWRRRADVPDDAELAWLYRTAGFVLANHRRKTQAVPVAAVPEVPDDVDPASLALSDDQVRGALAQLTRRDRQVLLLVAWDGLSGDDLAAVLGVSRGGADAALSRARARLRVAWEAPETEGLGATAR